MTDQNKIDWTPEDLRDFRYWEKTEQELAEARAALDEAKKIKRATERVTFRRWIKDPLGRRWLREINESRSKVSDAQARTDLLALRVNAVREKLMNRLVDILHRSGEDTSFTRRRRWLDEMKGTMLDLEDLIQRSLTAVGKTRNTMVHSYDRDRNAYPPAVMRLFRDTNECIGHLKRKLTAYEYLLGQKDDLGSTSEGERLPNPPSKFPVANLDRIESRPVAVNARELEQLSRELEDLQRDFLTALKVGHGTAKEESEERLTHRLTRRLEEERIRIKE